MEEVKGGDTNSRYNSMDPWYPSQLTFLLNEMNGNVVGPAADAAAAALGVEGEEEKEEKTNKLKNKNKRKEKEEEEEEEIVMK